jgi:hypothetical protein
MVHNPPVIQVIPYRYPVPLFVTQRGKYAIPNYWIKHIATSVAVPYNVKPNASRARPITYNL